MSWDALQLQALRAMGLEPLGPVGAAGGAGTVLDCTSPSATDHHSALQQALQRAAGGVADVSALPVIDDWAALASDPAAKKRLWPRLRTLRATGFRHAHA